MGRASLVICGLFAAAILALGATWRRPRALVSPVSRAAHARPASTSLGNDARWVLEKHCGLCHREDSPQAKAGALAVFNLNKPDWSASMTKERFASARSRLANAPSGGDPAPAEDIEIFDAFVATVGSLRD